MKMKTRQRAIRLTCLECSAWSRSVVRNCRNRDCPRWQDRLGIREMDPHSGYIRENLKCGNGVKTRALGVSERKKVRPLR